VLWDGCQSERLDGRLVAAVASALLLWHVYSAGCQTARGFKRLPCGDCGQLHFYCGQLHFYCGTSLQASHLAPPGSPGVLLCDNSPTPACLLAVSNVLVPAAAAAAAILPGTSTWPLALAASCCNADLRPPVLMLLFCMCWLLPPCRLRPTTWRSSPAASASAAGAPSTRSAQDATHTSTAHRQTHHQPQHQRQQHQRQQQQ
jgi:hypothetical protein